MIGSIIIILNWRLLRWMIFIFGTSFALSIRRTSRERRKWFFVGSASELQEKAWLQWILLGCIYVDVDFRPICTKRHSGPLFQRSGNGGGWLRWNNFTSYKMLRWSTHPHFSMKYRLPSMSWGGIKVPAVASVSEITRQILRGSDGKMCMGL